jgi:hypothetical protein
VPLSGPYCSHCGQRSGPRVQTLGHFISEAAEGLTHSDSRLWRTLLALLLRPGFLTAEFLAGRRARYLPPFRLYLVVSVLCFTILSFAGFGEGNVKVVSPTPNVNACSTTYRGPFSEWLAPRMRAGCLMVIEDGGRRLTSAFLRNLPTALFIALPLLAAYMLLLYWRPRRGYVEHLLFLVHNHSLLFIVLALALSLRPLLPAAARGWLELPVLVYMAWYFFRAMRVVYRQSRGLTAAKFLTMGAAYVFTSIALVAVTVFYSFVTQ